MCIKIIKEISITWYIIPAIEFSYLGRKTLATATLFVLRRKIAEFMLLRTLIARLEEKRTARSTHNT